MLYVRRKRQHCRYSNGCSCLILLSTKTDNNVTFVFSQSPPVKAALLFPDAAAFGVDLILGSASAAHLVQCCGAGGGCTKVRPTTDITLVISTQKGESSPSVLAFLGGRLCMTALPAASGFGLGYPCSWSCSSVIMYPCSFLYSADPTMKGEEKQVP